jgi:methylenetetrahydrofolate--tRNA-(uracil-5-)-methyltransferase
MPELSVIGGGLAGSEAAWQAAEKGCTVHLYEMRPAQTTGAHLTSSLAELVCSNSLGSNLVDRASGLLKAELEKMNSILLNCAQKTAVPAGAALAVDREAFSTLVTQVITSHPNIHLVREEMKVIPEGPVIIATGPLTSPSLAESIQEYTGAGHLFFFDAIAPIVTLESINFDIAFRATRYGSERESDSGDYINCPLDQAEFDIFVDALAHADRIPLRGFEDDINVGVRAGIYFEGCLPIEVIAQRSKTSLSFGPMRPVGLTDPRTGRWPQAAVQLRQDNLAGSLYNLVGFQTNLTYPEQKRVFQLIPGLEHAQFARYGQMHRNTFLASPILLRPTLQLSRRDDLFFAGQITGVEGYLGNIATGLLAGINAARLIHHQDLWTLPSTTMLGALCRYITEADLQIFQPMKSNFGILPPLTGMPVARKDRGSIYSKRALTDLDTYISNHL